jgi:hypothetical protein
MMLALRPNVRQRAVQNRGNDRNGSDSMLLSIESSSLNRIVEVRTKCPITPSEKIADNGSETAYLPIGPIKAPSRKTKTNAKAVIARPL